MPLDEVQVIKPAKIIPARRFKRLTGTEQMEAFLKVELADPGRELFGGLFLGNKHQLIAFDVLFHGSLDRAQIHPRQVVIVSYPSQSRYYQW